MKSILTTFVLYTVFIGGLSAQQHPKIQAKIIMVLDSTSFQSKSVYLALRITNLTDEDIYIPNGALRDTSGAYYTITGNKRTMSYPVSLRHQSVAHSGMGFLRSRGKLLSQILKNQTKRSFDIADEYFVKKYGKVDREVDFYWMAAIALYVKKHETVITNVLSPGALNEEELGTGEITATVKLENVSSEEFPEMILNYKKYIPKNLKITPLNWYWY